MAHIGHEPSMEEILSSIKRIIAEDGDAPVTAARPRRAARTPAPAPEPDAEDENEILELTDAVSAPQEEAPAPETFRPAPRAEAAPAPAPQPEATPAEELVSNTTAAVSRHALATLSRMVVKPDEGAPDNTLEGLVRDMLRPMLKDWLDANLPEIVKAMVAKEIARISGNAL